MESRSAPLPRNADAERRGNGAARPRPPRHHRTKRGNRTRQGKLRLLTLDALDQRCAATQAARHCIERLTSDLGGDLSAGERQLVERAALLSVVLSDFETKWVGGQQIALSDYLAALNTFRRLLVSLGLRRRPKDVTPSVADYLAEAAE
jgi:hypothetical protein